MTSKAREYIEKCKRLYRSPIEVLADVDARYGADAEVKMSYKEAHDIYDESIRWASWNDLPMQDYWALHCGCDYYWDEEDPGFIVKKVIEALREMADHLKRGQQLGLSLLEQRVVDTLRQWVPHEYEADYVACAREVSQVIVRLLPPEDEERTKDGFTSYYYKVMDEVERIAAEHGVEFEQTEYNLSLGYFREWLSNEYGIIYDDVCDREEDEDDL